MGRWKPNNQTELNWSCSFFWRHRKRLAESEARLVEAEKEREDRSKDLEEKEKEILQLKEEVENLKELDKIKDVTSQLRLDIENIHEEKTNLERRLKSVL